MLNIDTQSLEGLDHARRSNIIDTGLILWVCASLQTKAPRTILYNAAKSNSSDGVFLSHKSKMPEIMEDVGILEYIRDESYEDTILCGR